MITVPTVHLNGTSANELLDGWRKAGIACQQTLRALESAPFNARDYYVQGPTAWPDAVNEQRRRNQALRSVLDELQAICDAVEEQAEARTRR